MGDDDKQIIKDLEKKIKELESQLALLRCKLDAIILILR